MTATTASTDEWVERASSLAPLVEAHRDDAEALRYLPDPLVREMRARGLFCLWLPRALGGPQLSVEACARVMEALGRLDGSVGWNSMISNNHSILWSHLRNETAAAMTQGGATAVIAGTIGSGNTPGRPGGGIATPVPGGYRTTGRWPFASGCHHADWMVANGGIQDPDGFRKDRNGGILWSFLLPREEVTLLDNWHTTGMRGTGSNDFEGADVFVPEDRVFSTNSPETYDPSVLYNTNRAAPWSACIAGVAVGIARTSLDEFVAVARAKPANVQRGSLLERETVHRAVGEMEGRLRSARAFLLETARELDAAIDAGEPISPELHHLQRCASSTASLAAKEVCDTMFTMSGMSGVYATSKLDRCYRDISTLTQHAVGGLPGLTVAGKYFVQGGGPGGF
ncbi:MAG TPA: acyl-CoA dehydrogenase family protein [Dehalococcoidia bacterium]